MLTNILKHQTLSNIYTENVSEKEINREEQLFLTNPIKKSKITLFLTRIKKLVIDAGFLSLKTINSVANGMKHNNCLLTVKITSMSRYGIAPIFYALKNNKSITYFESNYNNLGDDDFLALIDFLKFNKTLKTLILNGIKSIDNSFEKFVNVIKTHLYLKNLTISAIQKPHQKLAFYFSEIILYNKILENLNLSFNMFISKKFDIAEALKHNTTLKSISFSNCLFPNLYNHLVDFFLNLKHNIGIKFVNLKGVEIDDSGIKSILEMFKTNYSLEVLHIDSELPKIQLQTIKILLSKKERCKRFPSKYNEF